MLNLTGSESSFIALSNSSATVEADPDAKGEDGEGSLTTCCSM